MKIKTEELLQIIGEQMVEIRTLRQIISVQLKRQAEIEEVARRVAEASSTEPADSVLE